MRTLRRFFKRLSSWATTRHDEQRLQARSKNISPCRLLRMSRLVCRSQRRDGRQC